MTRALLLLLLVARLAAAHTFEPAVLALEERTPGVFDVLWRPPSIGRLTPHLPANCKPIGERRVDCGRQGLAGTRLGVDGLVGSRVDAIVRVTWSDGRVAAGVLHDGAPEWTVPGVSAGAPATDVLAQYGRLGVEHILLGPDHLLFIAGLLLLVGSFRDLVRTVTAFTLAHSVTLALAALGMVHVPRPPVDAAIALSIVLLAAELTASPADPPTLARRFPWAVAFAFGLLHGLGFAGALADLGLPPDRVPLALLAFNGGVEVGQLAFVAVVWLPLRRLERVPAAWARLAPAYVMGTVAMMWLFDRVAAF